MEAKKSNRANLEKRKSAHFILGLIISLSLILISFEWTTMTIKLSDVYNATEISPDDIELPPLLRDDPKPPKPKTPPIAIVIELVSEDPELEPIIWDPEVTPGTEIWFPPVSVDTADEISGPEDHFIVQIMPKFNGGDPATEFLKYIAGRLEYPPEAVENRVSGKVFVKFVVNSQGYIERAEVLKGVHPVLDQEALRVINSSPRWEPGFQQGN
jgi:protein TonB